MDLTILYVVGLTVFLLIFGFSLSFVNSKTLQRVLAWTICVSTTLFCFLITHKEDPALRMVILVCLQLLAMKIIVLIETYSSEIKLNFFQWTAFSLGWFGMRPILFEKLPSTPLSYVDFIKRGVSRIIIGLLFLYLSLKIEVHYGSNFYTSTLFLLVGISFILHFGILELLAAGWRMVGVDVKQLFKSPYRAKSLKEFWGQRWNIAFSEMTARIAYKPLKNKFGVTGATLLAFFLSGMLHEVAISCPVNSGYGLPLLYFLLHGFLMYAEGKVLFVKKIIAHKVFSHAWVLTWLVLPMPLLFHHNFVEQVLKPLRNTVITLF